MKISIPIIRLTTIIIFINSNFLQAQDSKSTTIEFINAESFEVMSQFFEYDKDIPLEDRIVDKTNESDYIKEKIVFRGINDSRVHGYLALPKNENGPFPCILYEVV